ncbi:hypothetical protein D5F12_24055 [Serratia marcescens]|nr:hypothetical protein D4G80_24045 [Serratia marcescens]RXG74361.1 hypothetical protein D5F12_24055 [Serratia marcescens]
MSDTEQQEIYYAVFHLWAYDLLGTIQWRGVAWRGVAWPTTRVSQLQAGDLNWLNNALNVQNFPISKLTPMLKRPLRKILPQRPL